MNKITFCIPSKSNLRYLKTCIPSIRENSFRKDHDIIIFVDSDEDGTVEWLKDNQQLYNYKFYVNPNIGKELYGIGKAYDFCIEKSDTEVFMIFHADMMLGKNADLEAFKYLESKKVVCATRIEPPLHPNAGEKILQDFGIWPEDFKKEEFNSFVEQEKSKYKSKTTDGIFAPWMMYKGEFLSIGGHDPIMHSAREDSDVFNRLMLDGFEFIQSWESLVYHLTGRGGQFQHGIVTKDEQAKSEEWRKLMFNSTKEFIRKWGSAVKHTPLMHPILSPKYNIAFLVDNCGLHCLETLEPWADRIYVDEVFKTGRMWDYVEMEQENTLFDLSKRVLNRKEHDAYAENDIVVEFDASRFNKESFNLMQQLPDIIKESGEVGNFELDIFIITIARLKERQSELIKPLFKNVF